MVHPLRFFDQGDRRRQAPLLFLIRFWSPTNGSLRVARDPSTVRESSNGLGPRRTWIGEWRPPVDTDGARSINGLPVLLDVLAPLLR